MSNPIVLKTIQEYIYMSVRGGVDTPKDLSNKTRIIASVSQASMLVGLPHISELQLLLAVGFA